MNPRIVPKLVPLVVPSALHRKPLDACVRELFEASWGKARAFIESGKIAVDGEVCTDKDARIDAGASLTLSMNAPRPRADDLLKTAIAYLDPHLVVVDKPAGMSTIPYDENEKGTLDELVRNYLMKKERGAARPALGVVHRIDKETSGLLVFTRTWLAKQSLSGQFRAHTVYRRYLAIAHGDVRTQTFRTNLVENRGDGLRGSTRLKNASGAQLAITHVESLEKLRGATLVACRLETGRTHQIRIHLSEAGHPLAGERVYIRRFPGTPIVAPRMMLHAAELGFIHPATNAEVKWKSDPPADFTAVLKRLRG